MVAHSAYIGVDIQSARDCPYAVLNPAATVVESGWIKDPAGLRQIVSRLAATGPVAVGIDAPRMPLPGPRPWAPHRGRWTQARLASGRHCELVVNALKLATPQWTPPATRAPPWMKLGFSMFTALAGMTGVSVHEVFPTASYTMLDPCSMPRVSFAFAQFKPGPKDMLDAVLGALTVLEFAEGRGCQVGGGDGLGTIVLPKALSATQASHFTLTWPP